MAMNVSFKKGLKASLPATRDANTFYYVSDEFALYLGDHLISNEVTLAQFNALEARVKTLEDWKVALTELSKDNGANDLVKVTVTTEAGAVKSVAVDDASLDQKLADDLAAAKKYTDEAVEGIVSGSGYATQTWVTGEIQKLDADVSSTAPEAGKGLQVNVKEVDGKVTAVSVSGNYDQKYDALGAAANVLGNSSDAATANTVYGAKAAAAAAQADATTAKTKIETFLGTLAPGASEDIIDTLQEINNYVGEHGEEFAALSERVTKVENGTTIVEKAKADKDGNEFSATYAKKADLGDLAGKNEADLDLSSKQDSLSEAQLAAVNSGITATKVGEYDATKQTVDENKNLWLKSIQLGKLNAGTYDDVTSIYFDENSFNAGGGYVGEANAGHVSLSQSVKNSLALADSAVQPAAIANMATTDNVAAVQGEVDALEGVVAQNAQTCQNNFNTIVSQLTWGSF